MRELKDYKQLNSKHKRDNIINRIVTISQGLVLIAILAFLGVYGLDSRIICMGGFITGMYVAARW